MKCDDLRSFLCKSKAAFLATPQQLELIDSVEAPIIDNPGRFGSYWGEVRPSWLLPIFAICEPLF